MLKDERNEFLQRDIFERVSRIMDDLEDLRDMLEDELEFSKDKLDESYDDVNEMDLDEIDAEEDFQIDLEEMIDYCNNAIDEMDELLNYSEDNL